MINPRNLESKRKRWNNPRFAGGKMYLAVLAGAGYAKHSRVLFKRASEALTYAERLRLRWVRLYDAWGKMILNAHAEMMDDLSQRVAEPKI